MYSGAITTDKIKIKENEGFYTKNGEIIKTILPLPVKELKIENILKIEKSLFDQRYKEYLKEPDYVDIDDDSDSDDEDFEQINPGQLLNLVVKLIEVNINTLPPSVREAIKKAPVVNQVSRGRVGNLPSSTPTSGSSAH